MKDFYLPCGGVRDVKLRLGSIQNLTSWFMQEEQYYDPTADIGYLFEVELEMPKDGIGLRLLTEMSPLLSRMEAPVRDLSVLQLTAKKERKKTRGSHAAEDYKKITQTPKVMINLDDQIAVVFGETLAYLLKRCGVRISKIYNVKSFRQEPFLKTHITSLFNKRKSAVLAGSSYLSDLYKGMINKTYGATLVGGKLEERAVSPVIDQVREFENWEMEKVSSFANAMNPYASLSSILEHRKIKFEEEMHQIEHDNTLTDEQKMSAKEHAEVTFEQSKKEFEKARKYKQKNPIKIKDPDDVMIEKSKDPLVSGLTKMDSQNSASIKGYVSKKKTSSQYSMSFVGAKVLSGAKLSISDFVHSVIETFDAATRKEDVNKEMESLGILDVYVKLHVTDTDSAKIGIYSVLKPDCQTSYSDINLWIRKTLVNSNLSKIDVSSSYFESWGIQNKSNKKQYGNDFILSSFSIF